MCNNNFCWIILLVILFCNCGGNGLWGGNNCGNYNNCDNGCGNNCGCGCC